MSPEGIGAFLSGMGAVLGGWWSFKQVRKRAEERCRELIEELHAEYDRGFERGMNVEGRHETTE